ncbi:MAG: type II secretion system F family protein [Abditibacteriales bacterium]|nr:type II secretion system F family protein [Abditibacteriales bacterium]MDW8364971.1 type II secretion system F family protein [Abditibacteriales bacterium]
MARDIKGREVRGVMQGPNRAAVRAILRNEGVFVTALAESKPGVNFAQWWERRRGVKLTDLVIFSQQLSTMVGAGMDLAEAFMILAAQTENDRLRQVLGEISREIQSGTALSRAMERYPHIFPELSVALVKAGEVGGILEETLLTAAQNLERELELREKVKAAFVYPIIVLVVAAIVIAVMLLFVVPVFDKVYKQFRAELPGMTLTLIYISYFTVNYWWVILIGIILFLAGFRRFSRTPRGRSLLDRLKLRLPLLGKLSRKIVIARFIESLGALVRAGVPLLEGLQTSARVAANVEFQEAIAGVVERVKQGVKLSDELAATRKFPPMVARMIEVGEESGALDEMMQRISVFYHRDIEFMVRRLLTLLEPALTVVLGVIVGFILLALYLPIFTLATVIKK